jgi:UDP-N-acetylmuramate--alanine ligase
MYNEPMLDLKNIKKVHFTGIKGVGMTALACIAKDYGLSVTGSDTNENFVTDEILQKKGIEWSPGFSAQKIENLKADLLIYTAAHSGEENIEVIKAAHLQIPVMSQGQALGVFTQSKSTISIAGVGGKTTVTALLATIFENAGEYPSFMIGAGEIPSLEYPGKFNPKGKVFIIEADEYQCSPTNHNPKFYYQNPKVIVLPNLAFDHPDVYKDEIKTLQTFKEFITRIPLDGVLIANIDSPMIKQLIHNLDIPVITYAINSQANYQITNITTDNLKTSFTLNDNSGNSKTYVTNLIGEMNIKNTVAAIIVSKIFKISDDLIQDGILKYKSLKRRLEKVAQINSTILLDDYAHHPDELKATLQALKANYKDKKIIAIFQPHTYSRTRALLNDFAHSFKQADEVLITPIFASARETNNNEITSETLVNEISKYHRQVKLVKDCGQCKDYLNLDKIKNSIIITIGAGDIYKWNQELIPAIKNIYDR